MNKTKNFEFFKIAFMLMLMLLYFLVYVYRQFPAVIFPLMVDENLLNSQNIGFLSACFFYPYALIQFGSGFISKRFGAIKTLIAASMIMGIGSILFAVAKGYYLLVFARILQGSGAALILIPVLDIFSIYYDITKFHKLTCILIAAGGLGALFSTEPLIILSNEYSWNSCIITAGVICIIVAVILIYKKISELLFNTQSYNRVVENTVILEQFRIILRNKNFWYATVWSFFSCGLFINIGALWGGIYLENGMNFSSDIVGEILGMMTIGLIIGSPLLSFIGDHIFKSYKNLIIIISFCQLILFIFLLIPIFPKTILFFSIWFFLFSIFTIAPIPLILSIVKLNFDSSVSGIAAGFCNSLGLFAGGIMQTIGSLIISFNATADNKFTEIEFTEIFIVCMAYSIVVLITSFFIKDTIMGQKEKLHKQ